MGHGHQRQLLPANWIFVWWKSVIAFVGGRDLGSNRGRRFSAIFSLRYRAWRPELPGNRAYNADLYRIPVNYNFHRARATFCEAGGVAIRIRDPRARTIAGGGCNDAIALAARSGEDCARKKMILSEPSATAGGSDILKYAY